MLRRLLAKSRFDESWYLEAYPDVRAAIDRTQFRNAFDHYWNFGRVEGRFPICPRVDQGWYLSAYPDVRAAIAKGDFKSALDHYIKAGCREGRSPVP